ncbi:MAG: hypothetical protein JO056_00865 [Alphaproteobacteria bacterium]|nr:hypothetical protein [Alphaproteobacteria bacterium]
MVTDSRWLSELRSELKAKSAILQQIEKQAGTTQSLQERDAKLGNREAALLQAESHEAALRLLDGEETAPPNAKRRKELLEIKAEREPLPAAITLSQDRETELKKILTEVEQRIAHHAFAAASEIRSDAARAIKDGLDALASYVVSLAAADGLARGITHVQAVVSPDEFPDEFSGTFVADRFRKGLTFFVRPERLTDTAFPEAVADETARLLVTATEGASS